MHCLWRSVHSLQSVFSLVLSIIFFYIIIRCLFHSEHSWDMPYPLAYVRYSLFIVRSNTYQSTSCPFSSLQDTLLSARQAWSVAAAHSSKQINRILEPSRREVRTLLNQTSWANSHIDYRLTKTSHISANRVFYFGLPAFPLCSIPSGQVGAFAQVAKMTKTVYRIWRVFSFFLPRWPCTANTVVCVTRLAELCVLCLSAELANSGQSQHLC